MKKCRFNLHVRRWRPRIYFVAILQYLNFTTHRCKNIGLVSPVNVGNVLAGIVLAVPATLFIQKIQDSVVGCI
jgi:hypothetical protein